MANSHDNFKISTTLLIRFVHRNRILGNEKSVYNIYIYIYIYLYLESMDVDKDVNAGTATPMSL